MNNINRVQVSLTGGLNSHIINTPHLHHKSSISGEKQAVSTKNATDKSPIMHALKQHTSLQSNHKKSSGTAAAASQYTTKIQNNYLLDKFRKNDIHFDTAAQTALNQIKHKQQQQKQNISDPFLAYDKSPISLQSKSKSNNIHMIVQSQKSSSKTPQVRMSMMMSPDLLKQPNSCNLVKDQLSKNSARLSQQRQQQQQYQQQTQLSSHKSQFKTLMTTQKSKKMTSLSKHKHESLIKSSTKGIKDKDITEQVQIKDFNKSKQNKPSQNNEEYQQITNSYYLHGGNNSQKQEKVRCSINQIRQRKLSIEYDDGIQLRSCRNIKEFTIDDEIKSIYQLVDISDTKPHYTQNKDVKQSKIDQQQYSNIGICQNEESRNMNINNIISKSLVIQNNNIIVMNSSPQNQNIQHAFPTNSNINKQNTQQYESIKVQVQLGSQSPLYRSRAKHNSDYLDEKYLKSNTSPIKAQQTRKFSESEHENLHRSNTTNNNNNNRSSNLNKFNSVDEESDYLENIHSKRHNTDHSVNQRKRHTSRAHKKPVVKVDMDLESNQIHLIQAVPASKKKQKSIDRSILKRSLSQSAKSLITKANQLKEEQPAWFSPKPEKKRHVTTLWKVIDLKI